MVEHFLAKEDVASSSLVARSPFLSRNPLVLNHFPWEGFKNSVAGLRKGIIVIIDLVIFCVLDALKWWSDRGKDAQNRHKKPLRAVTADTRRYILQKFVTDCSINRVSDITLPRIHSWLDFDRFHDT